jgi:hypothetical protein
MYLDDAYRSYRERLLAISNTPHARIIESRLQLPLRFVALQPGKLMQSTFMNIATKLNSGALS